TSPPSRCDGSPPGASGSGADASVLPSGVRNRAPSPVVEPHMSQTRRRGFPWGLLVAAFVVVPLVEIYVIIRIGQVIGAWWTILLLIADSILGSWLVKREGGRAWRALGVALQEGRLPHRELADGI